MCTPCGVAAITHSCVCPLSSVVRSFRYVATLTAQRVVTSLVTATLLLGEARETAQRQLSAEKAKKGSKVRGVYMPATAPSTCAPGSELKPRVADVSPSDLDIRETAVELLRLACPDAAAVACLHVSVMSEAQHAATRASLCHELQSVEMPYHIAASSSPTQPVPLSSKLLMSPEVSRLSKMRGCGRSALPASSAPWTPATARRAPWRPALPPSGRASSARASGMWTQTSARPSSAGLESGCRSTLLTSSTTTTLNTSPGHFLTGLGQIAPGKPLHIQLPNLMSTLDGFVTG